MIQLHKTDNNEKKTKLRANHTPTKFPHDRHGIPAYLWQLASCLTDKHGRAVVETGSLRFGCLMNSHWGCMSCECCTSSPVSMFKARSAQYWIHGFLQVCLANCEVLGVPLVISLTLCPHGYPPRNSPSVGLCPGASGVEMIRHLRSSRKYIALDWWGGRVGEEGQLPGR